MGALYSGRCFAAATDAAHYYWSSFSASVIPTSPVSIVTAVYDATGWRLVTHQSGSVISSISVPVIQFAPCDPGASAIDGIALAFAVVGVWAVAYAVSAIRRLL